MHYQFKQLFTQLPVTVYKSVVVEYLLWKKKFSQNGGSQYKSKNLKNWEY